MSQQQLTTPIDMKNVTRIKPTKFVTKQDEDVPYCELTIELRNNDNVLYGTYTVEAFDDRESTVMIKNAVPASYDDRVLLASMAISGAYATLKAADDGASGNRSAHLDAVLAAARSIGVVSTDFASS